MKLFLISLVILSSFLSSSVWAQSACALHKDITKHLFDKYNERVTAAGLDARGNLIEIFSSDNGTWTIVATKPGGPTCVLSSGENWIQKTLEAKVPEEKT